MERVAVHLVIVGRVQGVGYRWWARDEATWRGLDGWVRNRKDGSVELVAAGPADAVAEYERLCWQGPASAAVTDIQRSPAPEEPPPGFVQLATA